MRHVNIVPLLGVWIDFIPYDSSLPAFVMPLMDFNLRAYLDGQEGRTTPVKTRIRWVSLNYYTMESSSRSQGYSLAMRGFRCTELQYVDGTHVLKRL